MKLITLAAAAIVLTVGSLSVSAQKTASGNELSSVTLYSRANNDKDAIDYVRSAFNFSLGLRSDDVNKSKTHNNYELLYGNINYDHDTDWFQVNMVTDDRSRIKDLGEMQWDQTTDAPYLPSPLEPQRGFKIPVEAEPCEKDIECQAARAVLGHIYVVHSRDRDTDQYTLFRVDALVPRDNVTISWKNVPSPEHALKKTKVSL